MNRICGTQALSHPQAQRARGKSCNSVMHDRKAVFHSRSFRPVKHNARPPSIEGKAVHSTPPALYRGRSGTGRKVAVHFSRFAPDAVRTSRYKGRAPRPIRWAPSLSPVRGRCPCPVDSAYYSSRAHDCQYVFEKYFFSRFFQR